MSAVTFAQHGGDMGDLEAIEFAGINRTAQRLKAFHEKGADEIGLEPAGLGLFHFLLHGKEPFRAKRFLGERVAIQQREQILAVEIVVNFLA